MTSVRTEIDACLRRAIELAGLEAPPKIREDAVLLDTGLDSLGLAMVVVDLEETLGYDPFTLMEEPVYPRTFGDFVQIYERFADRRR